MRRIVNSPALRWTVAFLWTGLVLVLMLSPSDRAIVNDTSDFFGGTDLTDAIGHVFLFGILTLFWWVVFACYWDVHTALWRAASGVVVLGIILEIGQYWVPERGVAIIDFMANASGVGLVIAAYRTRPDMILALITPGPVQ